MFGVLWKINDSDSVEKTQQFFPGARRSGDGINDLRNGFPEWKKIVLHPYVLFQQTREKLKEKIYVYIYIKEKL